MKKTISLMLVLALGMALEVTKASEDDIPLTVSAVCMNAKTDTASNLETKTLASVTNLERSMTLALRDWTSVGVEQLSLWFRGRSTNATEPLYVALSNTAGTHAVITHDDASAAQFITWTKWIILLQTFADQGINLTNVDKIAIGLGSKGGAAAGGSGTIYIDNIRLYRP